MSADAFGKLKEVVKKWAFNKKKVEEIDDHFFQSKMAIF